MHALQKCNCVPVTIVAGKLHASPYHGFMGKLRTSNALDLSRFDTLVQAMLCAVNLPLGRNDGYIRCFLAFYEL
eukprot:scaffold360_cov374-Pavlova_lutheri.AAC.46